MDYISRFPLFSLRVPKFLHKHADPYADGVVYRLVDKRLPLNLFLQLSVCLFHDPDGLRRSLFWVVTFLVAFQPDDGVAFGDLPHVLFDIFCGQKAPRGEALPFLIVSDVLAWFGNFLPDDDDGIGRVERERARKHEQRG